MSGFGLLLVTGISLGVMLAFMTVNPARGAGYGAGVLILYALATRWLFTSDHRMALWHLAHQDYEDAAESFTASFDYFQRHPWLDRFRFVILLSPTGYRYREMAMTGVAYSLARLERPEAIQWYEAVVREYPKNLTANTALALLRTGVRIGARDGSRKADVGRSATDPADRGGASASHAA